MRFLVPSPKSLSGEIYANSFGFPRLAFYRWNDSFGDRIFL